MEDKVAALRSFRAATDTEITELLIIIFIILFFILTFLVILNFRKALKQKFLKKLFMKTVKERGLSEVEGDILWKYSNKLGRDPFLSLEVKASFEKVIDLYVQEDPEYNEKMIQNMRKKLGFDHIPSFIPLTTTKDIELFQRGRITVQNKVYDASLYDKDEKYMYWALFDISSLPNIKGETVKIQFLRRDDAIYLLEGTVVDTFSENGRVILKIPHHSEMKRIQRRQYARIEVDFPVSIRKISEDKWITLDAKDISAGGIKVCTHLSRTGRLNISIGTELLLNFRLDGKDMNLKGVVVNITERKTTVCYGIKFVNINSKDETFIMNYVKKEQQKLKKLVKNRFG
ncbi:c-di-GMP-binding flagellar brake protein YcgR, contains PilZNR and PilZ domains [Persephonella hydrogeniphila]|uniref:C-di-GMP-binding flagellar brake protein YcgR, contains PilZNR and PilZ domains n=1 Tax=Persephonella hydrogeniphila TaxID=198703 RepID=A0A285N7C8_9AQUI|nr:PilZ domain-containing protein [Persephonella hydrogeniphila]SNZ03621.1 c-di-GMP-binding flagellar brake protein YcgR, contains PilZNR and PilZ domains [Persephonella hydrogeniphila]